MASNPYINRVDITRNGVAESLINISDTTAVASDVAQGKYFYLATGEKVAGTSSGGTGGVTQDQDGYLVLSDQGGGGGGSSWTLLATQEFAVSTTSTSNTSVGDITLTLDDYADPQTVLWVHIRDKAGKRAGHFYGSDAMFFHYQLAVDNNNSLSTRPLGVFYVNASGNYGCGAASGYGVYADRLYYTPSSHYVQIYSRYTSSYGTIDGTFKVEVYKLTMPSGMVLFEVEEEEEES